MKIALPFRSQPPITLFAWGTLGYSVLLWKCAGLYVRSLSTSWLLGVANTMTPQMTVTVHFLWTLDPISDFDDNIAMILLHACVVFLSPWTIPIRAWLWVQATSLTLGRTFSWLYLCGFMIVFLAMDPSSLLVSGYLSGVWAWEHERKLWLTHTSYLWSMDCDCERWSVLWAANSVTIELHVVNHLMIDHNNYYSCC